MGACTSKAHLKNGAHRKSTGLPAIEEVRAQPVRLRIVTQPKQISERQHDMVDMEEDSDWSSCNSSDDYDPGLTAPPTPKIRRRGSVQMRSTCLLENMLTQMQPGTSPSPTRGLASPGGSKLLPDQSPQHVGKPCLVLDLDETLVHAENEPFAGSFKVTAKVNRCAHIVYVRVRPGCAEFLKHAAEQYELVVFTASVAQYCDQVVKAIDPHGYISHCLSREHCTQHDGMYVKDLARLRRDLKDIILLDNNPEAYTYQQENGFPINSWYNDQTDTDLEKVLSILQKIAQRRLETGASAVSTLRLLDAHLQWNRTTDTISGLFNDCKVL